MVTRSSNGSSGRLLTGRFLVRVQAGEPTLGMGQIARKCRLYPTPDQQRQLAAVFGCCRKVYNLFIDLAWEWREAGLVPSHFEMCKKLTEIKHQSEYQYLGEVGAQCLQSSLKNLQNAFDRYFDKKLKTGPPQYKSRFRRQSAGFPQRCKVTEKRVWIPKVGWIRYRGNTDGSDYDGKTVIVSLDTDGRYYGQLQCGGAGDTSYGSQGVRSTWSRSGDQGPGGNL